MQPVKKTAAIVSSCLLAALIFLAPPAIHGDDWNLATRFTVNHPFEVPNLVLQPNTSYVIRLHDSPAERNVVQIFNADQTKMLTMFLAISDERMQPTDNTLFTFIETQPGYPLPIKEWFYPGRLRGVEFVYPKQQAMQISQHAREPILATESANLHKLGSISVEAVEPRGIETAVTATAANVAKSEPAPAALEKPTAAEQKPAVTENVPPAEQPSDQEQAVEQQNPDNSAQIAQNENAPNLKSESEEVQREKPAQNATTEQANTARELPRTAGELPLIALIGTLCLAAGLGIKAVSSKS